MYPVSFILTLITLSIATLLLSIRLSTTVVVEGFVSKPVLLNEIKSLEDLIKETTQEKGRVSEDIARLEKLKVENAAEIDIKIKELEEALQDLATLTDERSKRLAAVKKFVDIAQENTDITIDEIEEKMNDPEFIESLSKPPLGEPLSINPPQIDPDTGKLI